MPSFEVKNVTYHHLNYPSVSFQAGSTTFLTGPSGVGKSTLFKLLNGVITPTSGQIFYDGQLIETYDALALRRQVLLIGQMATLFDDLTIIDNFHQFFDYRQLAPLADDDVRRFLTICCLDMPLSKNVHELSGGEKQRVFIAIHLALGFDVLMMDEPTSALDQTNSHGVMENIKAYCESLNKTLLVISHDEALTRAFATEVVRL